ncbi:hypothetical protein F4820DRAFT_416921 [Hypoxylon rubiginosum]|uniref:Uncharacterized protein n=1 Tax=Hypoxylon rubiginosum TaxID=110542 RepID=A0ACB9Z4U3_9PEZI|nr:hypothetical protein F4820DRAFT_416921 [Hypoxylon rubiginosum]
MKGSRSTCLLCRHLLATSGRLRSSQRPAQVAIFSTTSAPRTDDPNVAATRISNKPLPADPVTRQSEPYTIRKVFKKERVKTPEKQWSQNRQRKAPAKNSARVDALFQQIVREQTAAKDAPPNTAPTNPNLDLALVQAIGKLERMVDMDDSVVDAYAYLKTDIYPMLREPDTTIPQVFYRTVSRLMEKAVTAKKEAIRSPTLPTLAEIFRVYVDIGEMKPQRWAMLIGELVKGIVEIGPSTGEQEYAVDDEKLTTRDAMLADLVESWKILSLPRGVPVTPDDDMMDGFWFPRVDKASLKRFSDNGNFPAALSSVFPQYPPNQLGAPVAVLAVATYALLLDPQRSNPAVRRSATRFVAKMAYLITFVNFRDAALRREASNTFPALETYVMGQWPVIKEQLKHRLESMTTSTVRAQPGESSPSTASRRIDANFLGSSLRRAYEHTRNSSEVDKLWQEFVGSATDIPPERVTELQRHPDLFDSFIHARMAMNHPDRAVEALHTLRKVGLRPTIKTWNTMLDGCKKARNTNAIKNVWAKIAASGMKLDMRIWTTRVSGLIESGDIEGGIQALQEMKRLWDLSSKDEKATAAKPTVEPVNAALVALIRQNQVSTAEILLVWASKQGIKPDIFTFNTLLRRFIRDGRDKDVRKVFGVMTRTGVRADEATFTIVLDEAFSKIAPDDTEEQANTVTRVVDEMRAAGLEVNLQTYGKMVYSLLRLGDRAREAVKAVLAHLWGRGLELSPHIYTMIVEHYFFAREGRPDLDAVESLLSRRLLLDYDNVDAVFYDRVIQGYSVAGRPARALEIYWRLSDAGRVVALSTQLELLRALLRAGGAEDARALVANTKRIFEESHRRGAEAPEAAGFWGHPFWRVASQHGVYEQNDATAAAAADAPRPESP